MKMKKEQYENLDGGVIPEKNMLNILGIWAFNVSSFASMARFLLTMIVIISYICSLWLGIYRQCISVDDAMDSLLLNLACMFAAVKLLINRINWRHMRVLVSAVAEDWSTVRDSRHERIMTEYFQRGRIVFLALFYMCYVCGPVLFAKINSFDELLKQKVMKYLTDSTERPNDTFTSNDMSVTTCIYGVMPLYIKVWVLTLQMVQISVLAIAQCSNDGYYFTLMMHLSGQFEILQMDLEEIKFDGIDTHKQLNLLVVRHCRLVMLVDHLKRSASLIVLLELLTGTMMMCIEGFVFLVSLEKKDTVGMFKSGTMIFTLISQLYLYAYAGDVLESRTEGVANAAYKSSWYLLRGNAAKGIALIISRGHFPCRVTAGNFGPMNRFTFKEAIKTAVSYLSVLRVVMNT